jgi:hypothetical protein
MNLVGILVIVLVVILILSLVGASSGGAWYPAGVGYWPGGIVGTILLILLVLFLLGRL